MLPREYINDTIVPLKTSDTGKTALSIMDEFRVSHLPIVNHEKLLGLVSDADIYGQNMPDEPLGNHRLSLPRPYVYLHSHFFDAVRIAATDKLSLVPVLDEKENYQGCITLSRMVTVMGDMASVQQPGGIIVLEVNSHDYALSEIARIVEYNDAKVLSAYVTTFPDSTRLEVTIKVNRMDVSPILQTFARYNYQINASFSEQSHHDELLSSRYDSLMNYLNI